MNQLYYYISIGIIAVATVIFVFILIFNEKEREAERRRRKQEEKWQRHEQEFRKFYELSEDDKIYCADDFYSTSPMCPTVHERRIAEEIVDWGFFNRYCVFLDCYFRGRGDKIGQVDVIAVGKRGVFVFESKDYSGWIFGNGKSKQWMEMNGGKKFPFYNPIKQNAGHIKILRRILDKQKFHSLVVFSNNAGLKEMSNVPRNMYVVSGFGLFNTLNDIMQTQPGCLTSAEVVEICRKIDKERLFRSNELVGEHIEYIHKNAI